MNFKPIKDAMEKSDSHTMSDRIMNRIEGERIAPCPRWQFTCAHYGVWVLWALSVVAGAIAVAVMMYVGNHARFALFEATHTTPLSFFVEVLPYVWMLFFTIMALFAYYNLRHTKRGYKYSFTHILLSSLVFSLVGGVILHVFGTGHLIDSSLSKTMPLYPSLERVEMKMWQNPAEGRLVGRFGAEIEPEMQYSFTDTKNISWTVIVTELREPDRQLLFSTEPVRLLGTTTNRTERIFHACGVFPWMFTTESDMPTEQLSEQRKQFITRMHEHKQVNEHLRVLEAETYPNQPLDAPVFLEGLCADIAAVKRVRFSESVPN